MTREQRVLAAVLQSRVGYNLIASYVDENAFTIQGGLLWQEIDNYYAEDPTAERVDLTLIEDRLVVSHPKHQQLIRVMLDELDTVSVPNVVKEYLHMKEDGTRNRLAAALIEGNKEEATTLIEELDKIQTLEMEEDTSTMIDVGIHEVLSAVRPDNIIAVEPKSLADRLDGGLIPGTQVCIFAPTEQGKTLFAINMSCGLLRNGRRVLYCGNEDPAKSILMRVYSNLSDMTKHEMMANPDTAQERANKQGFNNFIMLDMTPGTISEIRRAVEKYSPDVIFIDQMANMDYRSANKVEKNEALASRLRSIAKKYGVCTVIIHQGSDESYGKLALEKTHLYYSNVGVQGQMDVMIGIGMDSQYEHEHKRMLCLVKNKLSGDHSNFPIMVREDRSKVIE